MLPQKRRHKESPPELKKPRRKYKTRQKDKSLLKSSSEWSDRDWGLKAGGETAAKCYELLQNLRRHSLAGPFLQPVDPVALNLPDYLEVISDPIDLSTIERNLKAGVYQNSCQFATDIRRIWLNSFTYNASESDMFYITLEMATYFEKLFRELDGLVFAPGAEMKKMLMKKTDFVDYMNKPMSLNEKKILAANLKKVGQDKLKKVFEIVYGKKGYSKCFQVNVAKLSPRICRELEKLVKLSFQASFHANRQRGMNSIKRQYQQEIAEGLPEKRSKSSYYDE
jgi:hypothetical protein